MPADTPTLDDLISILSTAENLRASFNREDGSFPNSETAQTITLSFTIRRTRLDFSAEPFAFSFPTKILPETAKQLELLRELMGISHMMEDAYRFGDPKKSIDDAIAFIEQEMKQDTNGLGTLYTKMRQEHFTATLKYLVELRRRREEAEARLAGARKRRDDANAKAREEADRRGQEEKRRKWEEEEKQRRAWQKGRTSDSGYAKGSPEEKLWEAFRMGGGFDDLRGRNHFDDFRKAAEEELRRRGQKASWTEYEFMGGGTYSNDYGKNEQPKSPPPSSKRKWFEVLGCAAGADANEIRRAARNAAKGLHPDKNKDPKAADRFKEISEAKAEGLGGL